MSFLLCASLQRGWDKVGQVWHGVMREGLLTNHREQQQDTADDDGHNDGRLTAPQLQCGNGLVEVPNLDLYGGGGRGCSFPGLVPWLLSSLAVGPQARHLTSLNFSHIWNAEITTPTSPKLP